MHISQVRHDNFIDDFLALLLELLNIEEIHMKYKPKAYFANKTIGACCNLKTNTIYMDEDASFVEELAYFAHELRHIWHCATEPQLFEPYEFWTEKRTEDDYIMAAVEVDAYAFASVFTERFVGVKPLLSKLSKKEIKKIEERIRILEKELPTTEELFEILENIEEIDE